MCAVPEAARLTHSFKVVGSSIHSGFGVGRCVRSSTFAAGGYHWCIVYYPNGRAENSKDYVTIYLEFMSKKER
jgi:speckle-type POZ protein